MKAFHCDQIRIARSTNDSHIDSSVHPYRYLIFSGFLNHNTSQYQLSKSVVEGGHASDRSQYSITDFCEPL